jgi:WXG100 family type VII secretion target
MAFEGMDTDEVRSLAGQLQTQAQNITQVISSIDSIVASMENVWKGKDATDFQGWWQSQHRPHLNNAEQAIMGLHQSALNNAAQQDQASGQ